MIAHKLILIPLLLVCFGLAPNARATDPDGSGSETGLAPLLTNVDDFLLINDTAGDNRTHLFMASEFPALPNWRMDNNLGSLQFLQFGGVGTATRVTIADGGNVGIGTTTPGAPLHVVDTTPGPGSSVIMAARLRLTIGNCATSVCRIVEDADDCVLSTRGTAP